ncbi:MAG: tellurite resistance TerB family protein [Calothrix sp. C42_A2020_038]|nr:tellurite resistance TerB family protein [Calothrix sp. C42_A2020_038]
MGLFDRVLGNNTVKEAMTPAEAFAAITLSVVTSDGYLSEEEARGISAVLSRMKMYRSYSNELMQRMFDKILGILRHEGMNSLFDTAKESLSYEMRESAFAVAADLILADGIVTQEEKEFLNDLYQALSLDTDVATQILEVMLIKNRG